MLNELIEMTSSECVNKFTKQGMEIMLKILSIVSRIWIFEMGSD